jgi:hypothetical protein
LDTHIDLPARKSKKKFRKLQLHPNVAAWLRHPEVEAAFGRLQMRFGAEPLFPNPKADNAEKS